MSRVHLKGAAVAFALLTSCAHSSPAVATAPPSDHASGMLAKCPMGVPGAKVSAADAETGSTMTFTVSEQVAELQHRVHAMVTMHNEHHAGTGTKTEDTMGGGMMGGGRAMHGTMMPPSHATVSDLANGARVTLVPSDPADLLKLQAAVRMHALRMQENGCGMVGMNHPG